MIASISDLAWMQALGWTLVHFLWQGTIVGVVYAFVRRLVPPEQSSLRYAFGLFSLLALAVAPVLTLAMLWPSVGLETAHAGDSLAVNASLFTPMVVTENASALERLLPILVAAWLAGVALMIGRAVHQWRSLDQIARRLAWRDLAVEQMLVRVAERFGALPGVRVLVSANIDTPTLIGWLKPVIMLPVAVVAGFPREQLELILAHELGHLRRYDHLVNLAQAIVETLLFYHPVVHWISREVRHEREICCDNLVLRLTQSEPREYARTLAALEDLRQFPPQLAVAASGGMLLDRVRRIVGKVHPHARGRRSRLGVWLVAAGCSAIVATAVVLSRTSPENVVEAFVQPSSVDFVHNKPTITFERENPKLNVTLAAVTMPVGTAPIDSVDPGSAVRPIARDVRVSAAADDEKAVESTVPVPVPGVESLAIAAIDAADIGIQHAPIELSSTAESKPSDSAPKLVRMVAPDYPASGFGRPHAKVGFEFSIDRAGRVRNIRTVSGDMQSRFAAVARDALRQWRFDPESLASNADEKFHQDFEFVGDALVAGNTDDGSCATPTGSHVCRPGHPLGQARKSDEKAEAIAQADHLDAIQVEPVGRCTPEVGSHVCHPDDSVDSETRGADVGPTLKETHFLAGGAN